MQVLHMAFFACTLTVGSMQAEHSSSLSADSVVRWNQSILETAETEDGFLTLKGLRTAAMLHVAAHDALSGALGRYEPWREIDHQPDADPAVAMNQAALAIAMSQYPGNAAVWDQLFSEAVLNGASGPSFEAGVALGQQAADAILASREEDGWDGEAEYQWHPMAPGVYAEFSEHSATPQGFIFGSGWAKARPFVLPAPDAIRSPPPPPIDSAEYTDAYDEVRIVGKSDSTERTTDQTHLALWWKDFVENSHNRLARSLIMSKDLDAVDAHRLLALRQHRRVRRLCQLL